MEDVQFILGKGNVAVVCSNENSSYKINSNKVFWLIPRLDKTDYTNATIEIMYDKQYGADDIFPIDIEFNQNYNFYSVVPTEAKNNTDNSAISFEFK